MSDEIPYLASSYYICVEQGDTTYIGPCQIPGVIGSIKGMLFPLERLTICILS